MTTTADSPTPLPPHLAAIAVPGLRVFLDTNILMFATSPTAPRHADARVAIDGLRAAGVALSVSRQVLREYLAGMTRQLPNPTPAAVAPIVVNVHRFQVDFPIAEDGQDVTDELLSPLGQVPCGGKQVHDANIAATMIARGIPNLLTNNVADFTRFAPRITVVPL